MKSLMALQSGKGSVETYVIATCGICGTQERLRPQIWPHARTGEEQAIFQGWSRSEKHKWVCPLCSPPDLTKIAMQKVNE